MSLSVTPVNRNLQTRVTFKGVPSIVYPFKGDQPWNAKRIEQHQLGRALSAGSFSENELLHTIDELLSSEMIRGAITEMRDVFLSYEENAPSTRLIESFL